MRKTYAGGRPRVYSHFVNGLRNISLLEYCKDLFWQNLQHSQSNVAAPIKAVWLTMENGSIKTLIIQLRKRDVSMRTALTILLILFAFNIQAQSLKKNDPIYLYALSIDARITNGDKRMPKRVIVNNGIFNEVNELQASNYSKN